MSKMSQLHAELAEQAAELGFLSIEEAEANGYEVDYDKQKLVPTNAESELDEAHKAWLKERDGLLVALEDSIRTLERHNYFYDAANIKRAVKFIREQCHD